MFPRNMKVVFENNKNGAVLREIVLAFVLIP
jgi:hypothetical protein